MIVIEDLKVASISKSAAGTTSQPGRNVRAKSGLNRSILNQGWFELRRQLEYKAGMARRSGVGDKPGLHEPAVRLLWAYCEG